MVIVSNEVIETTRNLKAVLLYMCPHAAEYVSSCLYMCPLSMSSYWPYYGGGEVAVLFHASGLVFAMVLISFYFIFIFCFSTRRD